MFSKFFLNSLLSFYVGAIGGFMGCALYMHGTRQLVVVVVIAAMLVVPALGVWLVNKYKKKPQYPNSMANWPD